MQALRALELAPSPVGVSNKLAFRPPTNKTELVFISYTAGVSTIESAHFARPCCQKEREGGGDHICNDALIRVGAKSVYLLDERLVVGVGQDVGLMASLDKSTTQSDIRLDVAPGAEGEDQDAHCDWGGSKQG